MEEKTIEQYKTENERLQKIVQQLASSKSDDAIFIAELKVIVDEQSNEINALKQAITNAAKGGEK